LSLLNSGTDGNTRERMLGSVLREYERTTGRKRIRTPFITLNRIALLLEYAAASRTSHMHDASKRVRVTCVNQAGPRLMLRLNTITAYLWGSHVG
jgi:hypothetical protein